MTRILLTELGNTASGDSALWAESVRRLEGMGASVTLLHRLPDVSALDAHKMTRQRRVRLPLPDLPMVQSPDDLLATMQALSPEAYSRLQREVAEHDWLAIAPGGRFLEGYRYQKALVAAAEAMRQGKPFIVLHQSIGPLGRSPAIDLLRTLFRRAALVVVRDDRSLVYVRKLLGSLPSVVRSRDPLLVGGVPASEKPEFAVGLNFRFGRNGWVDPGGVTALCKRLRSRSIWPVLLYTTTHVLPEDLQQVAAAMGIEAIPDVLAPPEIHTVPGRCAVNVTDSFHGGIFSVTSERPAVFCQSDFASWKFSGTFCGGGLANQIHPGPVSAFRRFTLMRRIMAAHANPGAWMERQTRDLATNRALVETGWEAVANVIGRHD